MTVTLLSSALPGTGYAEEADSEKQVVSENFNSQITGEAPAGFAVSEGGGTVRIADLPDSSNKSVYLQDTSTSTNVALSKSFEPLAGVVTVEMKFMMPVYAGSAKVIRLERQWQSGGYIGNEVRQCHLSPCGRYIRAVDSSDTEPMDRF